MSPTDPPYNFGHCGYSFMEHPRRSFARKYAITLIKTKYDLRGSVGDISIRRDPETLPDMLPWISLLPEFTSEIHRRRSIV
jgi:hypothetical protein